MLGKRVLSVFFLGCGAAEPFLEMRRAEAGVVAGGKALIVQLCAEIQGVGVGDHLAWVSRCAQETPGEFIHSDRFGTGHLDRAFNGSASATSARAAATSSDAMSCMSPGDNRTVCPSVADCAMPFANSKNWVERTIVNGTLEALMTFS